MTASCISLDNHVVFPLKEDTTICMLPGTRKHGSWVLLLPIPLCKLVAVLAAAAVLAGAFVFMAAALAAAALPLHAQWADTQDKYHTLLTLVRSQLTEWNGYEQDLRPTFFHVFFPN